MNFPKELAALPQWICWRLEPDPKSEKPRKVPYDPKTGRKASSTNPQTWATLAEAEAARQKYLFTGVGFVFTEAGGIVWRLPLALHSGAHHTNRLGAGQGACTLAKGRDHQ